MTDTESLQNKIKKLEAQLGAVKQQVATAKRLGLAAEERANELYLDLVRTQEESRLKAAESDRLLDGLRVMTEALDVEQILTGMLSVLQDVLEFEHAFIITEGPDGILGSIVSTDPLFEGKMWELGKYFERALSGKILAVFDTSLITEWMLQDQTARQKAKSALHIPIGTGQDRALLVCTQSSRGFFTSRHIKLAGRFSVLATKALQNAKLYTELRLERDSLEQRVTERTREIETLARFPEENPYPVFRVSKDGSFEYSNKAGSEFLSSIGLEEGDSVPDNWQKIIETAFLANEPAKAEFEYDDRAFLAAFAPVPAAGYVNIYLEENTDQKKVEEALLESQAKLAAIIGSAMDGILTINEKGLITLFNPAAEIIFGRSNEEVVGQPLEILFPARFHNLHSNYVRGFAHEDVNHRHMGKTGVVTGLRADNQEFPLEGSISQVKVSGRKYFTAIMRDITERQRIEDELRDRHEFVLTLVNTMEQGLIVLDENAQLEFVNPAFSRMLQRDPEDLIGKTPYDLTHAGDHQVLGEAWERHKSGEFESFEARMIGANGMDIYALAVGTPRFRDGQFAGTIGVVTNLTERRQIEEALQESEARTRLIVETALDAAVTMDMEGRITGWNNQAENIFGWRAEDIIGQKMSSTIIPHQHRQGHIQGMKHYKETGEGPVLNKRFEITALRQDGREFPIELAITPLLSGGKIIFSAFIRDISERKQAEESLQEAKEVAEQAAKAKAEFLASMSHEIRTPLNAVIGLTGLLLDTNLEGQQKEYVQIARNSGHTLLNIINNILDYSKFEAGKLELEEQPFQLSDFLLATLELVENEAKKKGLELTWNISDEAPSAFIGDVTRMRQVLVNLLSNAVKFTEHGGVSVHVDGDTVKNDRFQLQFSVNDSGIGIPEDGIDQLFDAFSQVDASVTREYGGTGLGLAICRELVHMMGGRIWVESKLGSGSTFYFTVTLPIFTEVEIAAGEEALLISRDLGDKYPLSILLAEDDAVNQVVALHMLEKLGYRADVAANGLEVLDALRRRNYDVVFMDNQMPEMDGITAMKKIRSDWSEESQPRIIAMTAEALEGDRERFLDAGMDDYIPKPIMLNELTAALVRSVPEDKMSSASLESSETITEAVKHDPIDIGNFEERLGPGSAAVLPDLVDLFIEETEPKLAELRHAVETREIAEIRAIVHRLSGSSANISALHFASRCHLLGKLAREGNLNNSIQIVTELEQEYERIKAWRLQNSSN